jgi:hypothetical protein
VIYVPERHPVRVRFGMPDVLAQFSRAGAAVTQSPLSRARGAASPLVDRVSVDESRYAVVSADTLELHAPHLVFDSAAAADQALRKLVRGDAALAGAIQVVPSAILESAHLNGARPLHVPAMAAPRPSNQLETLADRGAEPREAVGDAGGCVRRCSTPVP